MLRRNPEAQTRPSWRLSCDVKCKVPALRPRVVKRRHRRLLPFLFIYFFKFVYERLCELADICYYVNRNLRAESQAQRRFIFYRNTFDQSESRTVVIRTILWRFSIFSRIPYTVDCTRLYFISQLVHYVRRGEIFHILFNVISTFYALTMYN